MQHIFDVDVATQYGVPLAIFLKNIAYWLEKNLANNKHIHKGRAWTYNSMAAFSKLFPYYTPRQIENIINKLIEHELIIKDNFNEKQYDRTNWYSLTDKACKLLKVTISPKCEMDFPKKGNGFPQNVEPIPDNKPDNKLNNNINNICASDNAHAKETFEIFWNNYKRKKDKARAFKIWCQLKLWEKADEIMAKLIQQNAYDAQYQTAQYIPHPTTYLRNARWEDEITRVKEHPVTQSIREFEELYNVSERKKLIGF